MIVFIGNYRTFIIRGILAILFGLIALIMPRIALYSLILLFGAYSTVDGIFNIIAAFRKARSAQGEPWWALLIQGIFGLIAGAIAFVLPGLTAIALLYLIAAWALVTGIMSIVAAIRLRKVITGEWLYILSGVLSVVFGILAFIFPGAGALAVVLWIGAYACAFGALLIALGLRLRSWIRSHQIGDVSPGFPTVAPGH